MKIRMLMTRVFALALALILLCGAQAESFSAIVTSGSMNVYADAGRTWLIGRLPATTVVTVESYTGDTALISLGGNRGFAGISDMAPLDSLATRVRTNTATRIYQAPNLSSRWLAIPAGMEINLIAVNGPWAMVENCGVVAYTNKDHLTAVAAQTPAPETPAQPEAEANPIVTETFSAVVSAGSMNVYRSASASSQHIGTLPGGVTVTVHAYNRQWAFIELMGNYGFAMISCLTRLPEQQESVGGGYIDESKYSVEQIIYMFLTQEMGLNTAVACGILANVQKECSFRVTAASSDGGYGICQWTGVRNTRLKNWCKDNGFDYKTLEGQLWYLKYELENHHPKTLRVLRGIENTPAGAYEAGHYFCYHFEVPANRATRAVERGNLAKNSYWQKYAA